METERQNLGVVASNRAPPLSQKSQRIQETENKNLGPMVVNREDSVEIYIERLVSSIEDIMPCDLLISSKCCIFKTPSILYRHNEKAYIPDAFSIGPLHHGSPNLKATEKIKVKYLQGLIARLDSPDLLRTLIKSIMEVEKDARECYAETIDHYNPEQLVKILVIDGCFIIELFRKNIYDLLIQEERDPIFSRSGMLQFLYHDLILLENQVPWMVLERLFNLTKNYFDEMPLILLAVNFFSSTHFSKRMPHDDMVININGIKHFVDLFIKLSIITSSTDPESIPSSTNPQPDQCINIECINRFVDFFRILATLSSTQFRKLSTLSSAMFRISSIEKEKESRRRLELLPSATSLTESGIKFKRGMSKTILEVKFNDGILEIPPFEIQETTETVFRNLISYEQCHSDCPHWITSYATLLDSLINTSNDINILCKNEIIDNWLNPEDAAQLFNKLYLDTLVVNYHYDDLCRQVNSFCRRRWPRWRAVLAHNYFNTPWAFISTLAAFILLVLTLLQTVYTIKK